MTNSQFSGTKEHGSDSDAGGLVHAGRDALLPEGHAAGRRGMGEPTLPHPGGFGSHGLPAGIPVPKFGDEVDSAPFGVRREIAVSG